MGPDEGDSGVAGEAEAVGASGDGLALGGGTTASVGVRGGTAVPGSTAEFDDESTESAAKGGRASRLDSIEPSACSTSTGSSRTNSVSSAKEPASSISVGFTTTGSLGPTSAGKSDPTRPSAFLK